MPGELKARADADELGLLTSAYTFGYRAALLVSEAVILPIAQRIGWNASYVLYGALMAIGLAACLLAARARARRNRSWQRKEGRSR